ncbi:biotin-dependent carboxyltransferase family protein [Neptunicella marina]|uniref:Biotin-dependent carboxyltransferase n=1 Tax=Neptunicella marina TaxID=2125989 RepID=A0A8J6IPJ2_9ALTE|nr:biotin-dependent carboxyltransferase family protein [Neptunicella marina]MBC3764389.1 biotin-dependent carboxyltransferase [Neptunicella marina]
MSFNLVKPGMLTLLQDTGRFGYAHLGLTQGGVLDSQSARWANLLCGNDENAPLLETTYGGVELEITSDCTLAITGAPAIIRVDNVEVPQWLTFKVNKGQKVVIGRPVRGIRNYIAIAGGFDVERVFNSSSMVMREQVGPNHGQPLKSGQNLVAGKIADLAVRQAVVPFYLRPSFSQFVTLRVVLGFQHEQFSNHHKQTMFESVYQVTEYSDRMGCRLQGPAVIPASENMVSEGIPLGAVQLPPDGQPIVMMNDHQTIGGYAKMGSVLSIDLALLAQCQPGAQILFEPIDIEQAQQILLLERQRWQQPQVRILN